MVKLRKSFLSIIIFLVLSGCGSMLFHKEIAKFNNDRIYFNEALAKFNSMSSDEKIKFTGKDSYMKFIRKIALEKIILNKATFNGLYKEKEIKDQIDRIKKDAAYDAYKDKNINNKISLNENDYIKYKNRYELYQIVKRTDILDQSKITANRELLEKLRNEGKDLNYFKDCAGKYSDDVTAQNGGYIGKIRLGVMEDNIDNAIEKLDVHKISSVIESSDGLHLLYINSIEQLPKNELYADKELRDLIISEKKSKAEEDWYEKILNDGSLKIDENSLKEKKYDDMVAIAYKGKKITRKEFFQTVDQYKLNGFPEPTYSELVKLAKNIGLNLILENKAMNSSILGSKEYRDKVQDKVNFLLINEYIQRNIKPEKVEEDAINKFYQANIKTLFTFKQDNAKPYIQPESEVKNFIIQKLESEYKQEARYELYRNLVKDENLVINDDALADFMKSIKK